MQRYYSVFNRYFFYVFLALMVFIPLYPKLPLASVSGTYVAIRLDDVFIAIVLGIWFLLNIGRIKELLSKNVTKSYLIFLAIGLLSLFSGLYITFSITPHLGFLNWLRRVESMSLLFVAWTTITNKKQLKIMLLTMLVVTVLICLYGIGQVYVHLPVVSTSNREFSKGLILQLTQGARPNSTFAGAYDLGVYLSMVLVYLAAIFFFYRKVIHKVLISITGVLSAIVLGMTAARTAFAAAFLGIAAVFWALKKRMLIVGLVIAALVAVLAVPPLRHRLVDTITVNILNKGGPRYVAPPPTPTPSPTATPRVTEKLKAEATMSAEATKSATPSSTLPVGIAPGEPINTTELDVSRSVNIRTQVEWPRAVHAFYKDPLLGTGYSSLTIATDNDFLRSLGEVGILGTVAFGLMLWAILKQLWVLLRSSDRLIRYFTLATIVMVFAFLINGVFIDVFESSKVAELFWMIVGVNLAVKSFKS